MTGLFHPYDVNLEAEVKEPLNFSRRDRLQHVDRTFKSEITNITKLTDMEKLFHIRIVRRSERERFTFLPGQFVMVEVPGYGEIPISISGSATQRGMLELCIRRAGLVTGVLHRTQPGSLVGIRGPFGTHFPLERIGRCPSQGVLTNANTFRTDQGSFRVHGVQDVAESLALLADQVLVGDEQIVDEQHVRVDRLAAHLLDQLHLNF